LVVSKTISDQDIEECSKFRTRERFPALAYYNKNNGTSIWRSSQPKEGLWGYINKGDQNVLSSIIYSLPTRSPRTKPQAVSESDLKEIARLHIIDARPKLSAIGNKVMGSGYENTDNYPSTWLHFCEIENIHKTRDSFIKLQTICNTSGIIMSEKWLSELEKTEWLQYLAYILKGVNMVVESIRMGKNVLVHCSDGWDRTAQLTALSQLILDKYYRTIEGFEKLIEKDFIMFGHQFRFRLGHKVKNALTNTEFSPIFIQFLDCVHQISLQFPTIFEFNDKFLREIAYNIYSNRFGNFLVNSEKEQKEAKIKESTVSLWSYMNSKKEIYKNSFYIANDTKLHEQDLYPEPILSSLRLWEELYMKWSPIKYGHKSQMYFFRKVNSFQKRENG